MTTLILVTCDSGAGHLKQEKRADRILTFTHRLVMGPAPVAGPPETFFQRRQAIYEADGLFHEPWWFDVEDLTGERPLFKRVWSRLPDLCRAHDRVELWIDPDPNAQLVLLQLLDWLGHVPEVAPRLWLKQSDSPLGEQRPGDWALPARPVEPADVALAGRAWAAFGSATPHAWTMLRDQDLGGLPGLRSAVERMLDELPDGTGLGATARRLLRLTEQEEPWRDVERPDGDRPSRRLKEEDRRLTRVFQRVFRSGERVPLWHFEVGETLCELGGSPAPALAGVTERHFTLDMHEDRERLQRFHEASLHLTELGRRLVGGLDDRSRHSPIRRRWGGTRLTNDALWRWDATCGRLMAPT